MVCASLSGSRRLTGMHTHPDQQATHNRCSTQQQIYTWVAPLSFKPAAYQIGDVMGAAKPLEGHEGQGQRLAAAHRQTTPAETEADEQQPSDGTR